MPVVEEIDRPLPEFLPLVEAPHRRMTVPVAPVSRPPEELHLLSLLAQLLTELTLTFEARSSHSLATCAALVRPLGAEPVLVRDLPDVTGVAAKDWDAGVKQLERSGVVAVGTSSGKPKGKTIRLTDGGLEVQAEYPSLLADVERPGAERCRDVRVELERVVGDALEWTRPYPDNWRARRPVTTLPHQPIVSHRGGYPDGS